MLLQYCRQRFTSTTASCPLYSYSILAGIGYFFSFNNSSTCLIGVSPSPNGVPAP